MKAVIQCAQAGSYTPGPHPANAAQISLLVIIMDKKAPYQAITLLLIGSWFHDISYYIVTQCSVLFPPMESYRIRDCSGYLNNTKKSPKDFSIAALRSQAFTRSTHFSSASYLRKIVPAESAFGPLSAVRSLQWSTAPLGRRLSAAPQRKRLRQQLAFCIISAFQQHSQNSATLVVSTSILDHL